MVNDTTNAEYFAAANGFSGFRSYFDEIFNPEKYEYRLILKGGPGTGKSSFMKAIRTALDDLGCRCEVILCSSDPNSYDGLIITSKSGKRICVLDGTAPHEVDATHPGFVDALINLGEFWDEDELRKNKDELHSINAMKKSAYKNAYDSLRIAGMACEFARKNLRSIPGKLKTDTNVNNPMLIKGRNNDFKLITAFCKEGFVRKNQPEFENSKVYSLVGNLFETEVVFDKIIKEINEKSLEFIKYHSPLSHDFTDAIYIPELDYLLITNADSGEKIECKDNVFIKNENLSTYYGSVYSNALNCAQNEFKNASAHHFALEKIYSSTMDFDGINKKRKEIVDKIIAIIE